MSSSVAFSVIQMLCSTLYIGTDFLALEQCVQWPSSKNVFNDFVPVEIANIKI